MATKGVWAATGRSASIPMGDDSVLGGGVVVKVEGVERLFFSKVIHLVFRAVLGIEKKVERVPIYSLTPYMHNLPRGSDSEDTSRDNQEVLMAGQSSGGGSEGKGRKGGTQVPGFGSWRWHH